MTLSVGKWVEEIAGAQSPAGRRRSRVRGLAQERGMKMYILIRESVPTGFARLAAAHASLACYLAFRDSPEVAAWLSGPFYKVVCKVSDDEFESAKAVADRVILPESALDGAEVALAFKPREEWPPSFRFYRLYK